MSVVKLPRPTLDISRKVIAGFVVAELYTIAQSIADNGFNWKIQLGVALSAMAAYVKTEVFSNQ